MEKEIYVDFSGWCKLSPETKMQCISQDESLPDYITVEEWSKMSQDHREQYILEDIVAAIRDSEDVEYESIRLSIN